MLHLKRTALVAVALVGLAASGCGTPDLIEPSATQTTMTQLGSSVFIPSVNLLKTGIPDGVYTFKVDPDKDESLLMGTSLVVIPANSICRLETSGYGSEFWNTSCEPQQKKLTITVVSSGSNTHHPRVDFSPDLRFNPKKTVTLYIYDKAVTREDATRWVIYYCGPFTCVNEALTDPSLASYVDTERSVIYRRIKHLSGYLVAE